MAARARLARLSLTRYFTTNVSLCSTKSLSEIPGMRIYPGIGSAPALIRGKALSGYMHECLQSMYHKHGPIFKFGTGGFTAVAIHDPDDIKKVFRKEGKWPQRGDFMAWEMVLEEIGEEKGIVLSEGAKWQHLRSIVTKDMMRPRCVAVHTDNFRKVAEDMVERLVKSRDSEHVVPNITEDLFKWAFESASTMIFEKRLGLLGEDTPEESLDFISTVIDIFDQTEKLFLIPPRVAKALRLPLWSSYRDNWKRQFKFVKKYIDQALDDIAVRRKNGQDTGGLIEAIISGSDLSYKELYALMLDLMGASVDTTSSTTCFILDLLSRHPGVQERLYQEVISVAGDEKLTYEHIQHMPYMKAVLKETMRMYPLLINIQRVLKEEVVLGGYKIPADTPIFVMIYNNGRDPSLFPNPEEFRPDRWLRSQTNRDFIDPYSSLPFGFGKRACVGRRIAELEMYLLTASILRRFRLVSNTKEPIHAVTRLVLRHKHNPRIQFIDRP